MSGRGVTPDPLQAASLPVWRILLAVFLTVAGLFQHGLAPERVAPLAVAAALLPVYVGLLLEPLRGRFGWPRRRLATVQVGLDLLGISVLAAVAAPGAVALPVFFCVPVVLAAAHLGRTEATATAAWAALLTVLIPLVGPHDGSVNSALFGTGLQAAVFLAVGLAAGELAERDGRRRRRQAKVTAQMHRARTDVREILDNLGSGLLTVSADLRITRANPAALRILGLGAEPPIGRPLADVLGPDREPLTACIRAAIAEGQPRRRAEVTVRRDGQDVPLGLNVNFLGGQDGGAVGVVAVFTDLTEVRRMQENLRRADRLAGIGELAASIAHEIRNPLASIRGSVEILAGELELEGHQEQLLQLILKESARVNRIIEDFLRYTRLRPAQTTPVGLDDFLRDVVLQIEQHVAASDGNVQVELDVEPGDLAVRADPEQLVQLFLNLAINGCEAMQYAGCLRLEARAAAPWCVIQVSDTGPGLAEEIRAEIFDPFVTTKKNGTGLGLPVVARVVDGHGGTIEAGNGAAGGAVFTLRLPLAARTAARAEASSPAEAVLQA